MKNSVAVIDGDIVLFKSSVLNEQKFEFEDIECVSYDIDKALEEAEERIREIQEKTKCSSVVIALSSKNNFRKKIYPPYKKNREGVEKPKLYYPLKEIIEKKWTTKEVEGLEGDDVLGIYGTYPKLLNASRVVVVSEDKDLKTIPCLLFNPSKDEKPYKNKLIDADRFWMMQTLTGDTVDNYKGCPSIGIKRATKLLEDVPRRELWEVVVEAFKSKGLTEEDALLQARLSRILRKQDYDFKNQKVKLWSPK